jgi:Fic family protein
MTFDTVIESIEQTVFKTNFWRKIDQTQLKTEQVKVLNRMLDGDFNQGINASQYQKATKVSRRPQHDISPYSLTKIA